MNKRIIIRFKKDIIVEYSSEKDCNISQIEQEWTRTGASNETYIKNMCVRYLSDFSTFDFRQGVSTCLKSVQYMIIFLCTTQILN
jgi:hypothetical protein